MGYVHVEIETFQTSKHSGAPCGDVVAWERTASDTTLICADGIGSGIRANIAAQMCASRLMELFRRRRSLREAFASVVETMNKARGTDLPYAAFTVARILNDGVATVLTYEMPEPIFTTPRYADVLPQRVITLESALIGESNCHIEPGEGLVIVTDGITQAGLGAGLANGWCIEGASHYISDCFGDRIPRNEVPRLVVEQARGLCRGTRGDDCTVAMLQCRVGRVVNVMSGPPRLPLKDKSTVRQYLLMEGKKVVCGGTTAQIVAKCTGKEVEIELDPKSLVAPPRYSIQGVDLVTEGAVTLNQVYNLLEEDPGRFREESGVRDLCELLQSADRVNFIIGIARNPACEDISFLQQGILTRQTIVPLLSEKLQRAGKLVVTTFV